MLAKITAFLFFLLFCATSASAHFGMLIPSHSMAMSQKEAEISLSIAFSHPFARQGMEMKKPAEFFVMANGKKTDLAQNLKNSTYMGQPAFTADFKLSRPGVYAFAVNPLPYYEPAENAFIIHYAKTIIGAFGAEEGWNAPLGLPMEIVPLSRPFGNYSGNIFTGQALKNGKPAPHCIVEVEFLNEPEQYAAPNAYFETQTVLTDANGVFSFGIPWPGWWGFAALAEADEKMEFEGQPKDVELGGVIWVKFDAPQGIR